MWDPSTGSVLSKPGDRSHGVWFGHTMADRTFKGRYDAFNGKISVVFPNSKVNPDKPPTVDDIPTGVYRGLTREFPEYTEMVVFW